MPYTHIKFKHQNIQFMAKYNIRKKEDKYAAYRSLVNPKLMDELQDMIQQILISEKRYRDRDYSAKLLADDLGTNTRYISAVVNVRFHMSYTSLVNKYRIEDAMSILIDKRYLNLNMSEISELVGFNNRQSFYAAFYRINGITPRDYRIEYIRRIQEAEGLAVAKEKKNSKKK